jgi:hypothetical protein
MLWDMTPCISIYTELYTKIRTINAMYFLYSADYILRISALHNIVSYWTNMNEKVIYEATSIVTPTPRYI